MSGTDATDRYEVNRPEVVDSVVDGEVVAISLSTGSYYNIAGSGTDVWTVFDRPATVQDVVDRLTDRYEAPADEIDASVARFVDELLAEGLIRVSEAADPAPGSSERDVPDARSAFSPPVFEKFTDMEDLLLLDPVHDVTEQGWPHVHNA